MEVRVLDRKDWEKIKPFVHISGYGTGATFFHSVEDILKADKVVTLNGSPLRKGGRVYKSVEERLATNNQVVKLPNGMFAVASKTLLQRAGLSISMTRGTTELPEGL